MGRFDDNPVEDTRHPATEHMLDILDPNPNLEGRAWEISDEISNLASHMVNLLPDGPELTEGLRKLWEAKNNLVMAHILEIQGK